MGLSGCDQAVKYGVVGEEASQNRHPVGQVIDVHEEKMGLKLNPVVHLTVPE